MKHLAWIGSLALVLGTGGSALAQQPPATAVNLDVAPAVGVGGEWIDSPVYGRAWIPAGAVARPVGGDPYAYFYTPHYGWTWHASPWGWGAYHRGAWLGHPWGWHYAPRVWYGHGWVHPGWRR